MQPSFQIYMGSIKNKSQLKGPPLVFEIYKFQMTLWACLSMPDHAHLNLHDQSVTLIDMKLHAQKQLYTSISF